ncbi:hypothetical protein FPV67DRAFT_1527673 [Lyophyllum atratum]|nr:hypothetical protein FPV67DRAFT_1527673 [Lyophyllum atratum]
MDLSFLLISVNFVQSKSILKALENYLCSLPVDGWCSPRLTGSAECFSLKKSQVPRVSKFPVYYPDRLGEEGILHADYSWGRPLKSRKYCNNTTLVIFHQYQRSHRHTPTIKHPFCTTTGNTTFRQ